MAGLAALLIAATVDLACKRLKSTALPLPPATKPLPATTTTAPATQAAATTQAAPPRTYVEFIRRYYPDCPTSPPDTTMTHGQGARLLVTDPLYIDRTQNLWITRSDADETEKVLAAAGKVTEHLVRERPLYAHWRFVPGSNTRRNRTDGHWTVALVCPTTQPNVFEIIEESRRTKVTGKAEGYYWPDAFSLNRDDTIVVGQSTGASVFVRSEAGWEEIPSPPLVDEKNAAHAPTQMPVEFNGVLAYIPADAGHAGSRATARYSNGKWSILKDEKEWPGNFLHLIPLADGSVLQIVADPPAADHDDNNLVRSPKVHLAITAPSDTTRVDKKLVMQLIEQLDSRDAEQRKEAFQKLAIYGSSLWPILEEQMPSRPDGVKEKLAELLKNKTEPTLGEMSLVDPRLVLAARTTDGGALFYDEGGVSVINVDGDQTLVPNAWISVLSGQPIRLLVGQAWADLTPERKKFYNIGGADWIVVDEAKGPQEIVGTFGLEPILKNKEVQYSEFVGADRRGRWFFRDPTHESPETLILDPTLPPVKPRLPVWAFNAGKDATTGWDARDFPAYKDKDDNVWVVDEFGFHVQDKTKEKFLSERSDIPRPVAPASTRPAAATSLASSRPSTSAPTSHPYAETEPPLLVQSDGTAYYGGLQDLRIVKPDGATTDWKLPPETRGSFNRPWLAADKDGRLFLFNEPGRIVRLRAQPAPATQPFKVDATFAHNIPNEEPTRMWIDPANRLVIVHDGNEAAICFPVGVVPEAMADKIPGDAKDAAEGEDE